MKNFLILIALVASDRDVDMRTQRMALDQIKTVEDWRTADKLLRESLAHRLVKQLGNRIRPRVRQRAEQVAEQMGLEPEDSMVPLATGIADKIDANVRDAERKARGHSLSSDRNKWREMQIEAALMQATRQLGWIPGCNPRRITYPKVRK